jgi:hypothetical protein
MVLGQCGYYCFCSFQMYLAKQSAREKVLKQIPENLLTRICLQDNNNPVEWEEEGKEFSWNGEMYDVVKIKNEDGKAYAFCISDKKEDKIIDAIEKIVKSNTDNSSDSGKHNSVGKSSIPDWVFELQLDNHIDEAVAITQNKYFNFKSALYFNYIEINSPPPNFLLKLNRQL